MTTIAVSPDSVFEASIRSNLRRMRIEDDEDSPFGMPIPRTRHRSRSPRRSDRDVDARGNTALIQAVMSGSKTAVERCLNHGASIDAQNYDGQTALYAACAAGHDDIAESLLLRRADPNIAALDGSVPLHAAAASDDERLVALLVDHGAFPNARDDEGDSPLHWAAREGSRRAAALLLRRGADPALTNEDGETPLDVDPSVLLFGSVPSPTPALLGSPGAAQVFAAVAQGVPYSSSAPCMMLSSMLQESSPVLAQQQALQGQQGQQQDEPMQGVQQTPSTLQQQFRFAEPSPVALLPQNPQPPPPSSLSQRQPML
eukprot:m51a1_g905 hypothetical protein (315) ;mRNA; f:82476-83913